MNLFAYLPSESAESSLAQISCAELVPATATLSSVVNIVPQDIGDDDRRAMVYDVMPVGCNTTLYTSGNHTKAAQWARDNGFTIEPLC